MNKIRLLIIGVLLIVLSGCFPILYLNLAGVAAMKDIQIFNVGAERMLGYTAAEVVNKITPADISDPQELIVRAKALKPRTWHPDYARV